MLSVASGYSPQYLLKEVATGRENYYTGAVTDGEPPGRWWGAGAEKLGLTGLVDAQDMTAVYERFLDPRADGFKDPSQWDEVDTLGHAGRRYLSEDELYTLAVEREPDATAERRAELRVEAGKVARHNVAFFDVTFSVQKSVTLLHTAFEAQEVAARTAGDEDTAQAWSQFREAVENAIWAGNNAGLAYLAEHAGYTRVGHHGGAAGRHVDAHDWVVASFFQHDSRDHDPQLHIHNGVLNRVEGPDGTWRTLDGRALYRWRPAAGAVAERTCEESLSHRLGVLFATRPDGKSREIVGVPAEAMELISSRRRKVTAKAEELFTAFEARFGRAPNNAERDRLSRQATFATRAAKSHDGETREQVLDRVDRTLRADITGGLHGVAHTALAARGNGPAPQTWSPRAVIETALADAQSRKAAWTRADLTRAINAALPDYLGLPDGTDIGELLDQLTDEGLKLAVPLDTTRPGHEMLPGALRLANGESAYQSSGAQLYCTPEHVRSERFLLAAAHAHPDAAALSREAAQRFLKSLRAQGVELGVDQAAAVRGVLTSGARVETLVGPAGTGKSFVVGTLARAWTDPTVRGPQVGRVFGLATSQVATDVLAAEGLTARNVAAWLSTQNRLAAGPGSRGPRPVGDDEEWRLRAGDLVVVDESAMTDTAALAAIHQKVDAVGAKLLLVGDHRQLAAVGAGGAMDLLAHAGTRYELVDARRFTAAWEREASLRLRDGDETVLRDYHRHGRLLDTGTVEQAEASAAQAWLGDTLAGRRSLLIVDTNEQAARVSAEIRAVLVRLGQVQEDGVTLGLQGTIAGVGDLVEARKLDWTIAGYENNRRHAINREHYRVRAVRPDGALEVAVVAGRTPVGDVLGDHLVLPPSYVAQHLALGYASTVHAAQGGTVDTTHTVVTGRTGPAALYVGMSRGRDANTAHVATTTTVDDPARGTNAYTVHRDPIAVLAGVLDQPDPVAARSAVAVATESVTQARAVRTPAELLADAAHLAATERTAGWLDQLTHDGHLTPAQRARVAAEDGTASLTRVLRRAELSGHDPRTVLLSAVVERPLEGARSVINVLYRRIADQHRFDPVGQTWVDWTPRIDNPEWRRYLAALADAADARARELGRDVAEQAPGWAVEAFGAPPEDELGRGEWEQRAALVAGYRELVGHDDVASSDAADALGPAPQPGQVEAYAAYRAAWRALGRPEIDREETELSDGQLRMRVRAWEREKPWSPCYVGNEMAGTHQAAAHQHRVAALRQAEAAAAEAKGDRAAQTGLARDAANAAALARTLDNRANALQALDDARAQWLAHTAMTRVKAERSAAMLAERHATDTEPDPVVTAAEWLAAQRAADAAEDPHRNITEADLASDGDGATDTSGGAMADGRESGRDDTVEADLTDLREVAAAEPAQTNEDVVRVPSADDIAAGRIQATRAVAEIRARSAEDERIDEQDRANELNRWHHRDQACEGVDANELDDIDKGDVLIRG